jgi:RHS repeat-associated protein
VLRLGFLLLLLCGGRAFGQAPSITGLSPTSGPVGTLVTIAGSNFGATQASSTIALDGTTATVVSWAGTSVAAIVPSGASSGSFTVTVSGTPASSSSFTITALPSGWSDGDVGSVGVAGSATYANGTFTVMGAGTEIYGTADAFHFAYQALSGNGTIIARVVNVQGGNSYAAAGVMIRETLTAGSTNAKTAYWPTYHSNYFDVRTTTGGSTSEPGSNSATLPCWVEVVRSGSSFTSYTSPDGVNWSQLGSTQTISMAQNVYIGLAVTSANTSALATATFDNVSVNSTAAPAPVISGVYPGAGVVGSQITIAGSGFGSSQGSSLASLNGELVTVNSWSSTSIAITIPSGATSGNLVVSVAPSMNDSNPYFLQIGTQLLSSWTDVDVGSVGLAGSASYANSVFTVNGSGQGLFSSADELNFMWQPLSGDGSIVARVVSLTGNASPPAGVMIRETLNANANSAFSAYRSSTMFFVERSTTGASSSYQTGTGGALPYWVALSRVANTFTSYTSIDGVNWVQVGTAETISMAQNVYIGLAVSSDDNTSLSTAVFDNVSLNTLSDSAPTITTLSATTGSIGSQVVISGLGFGATQNGSVVLLNGAAVTVNSWSSTSITITIASGAASGPMLVSVAPSMNESNYVDFTVTTQPLPTGWLDQDIGLVGIAGSATYNSGTFTVNAAGQGVFTAADQIHFVYQSLSGDGTIVARVVSLPGSSSPMAGVMIRDSLNASSTSAYVDYRSATGYFVVRTTTGAASSNQTIASAALAYWVRLVRSGSTFTGYTAPDGVNWTQVGTTQTISMAQNVFIGLAVSSGTASSLSTATIDNVSITTTTIPAPVITSVSATTGSVGGQVVITGEGFGVSQSSSAVLLNGAPVTINSWSNTSITMTIPSAATSGLLLVSVAPGMNDSNYVLFTVTSQPLPSGWLDQDIGAVGVAGSATYSSPVFTINGAGQGLYSSADQFHFVYQPLLGDGTIIARVATQTGSNGPIAGVMIRATPSTGSTSAYVAYRQSSGYFVVRTTTGATSNYQTIASSGLPYWVKLVRSGGTFSAYSSTDGSTWAQVGTTQAISMAQNVYIGLAVSSDTTSSLSTATIDNVTFTPGATPNVTSLSPYTGGVGTAVTINGTDFGASQGSSTVTFNGFSVASVTSWSNAQIVAIVPSAIPEGPGPVVVTVNSLPSNATVLFTAIDPVITSLAPPAGPPNGIVVLSGTGFGSYLGAVQFNGVVAHVMLWSDTSITLNVPLAATTGPVTVTVNGFTSAGVNFTVIEPVSISGISPTSGVVGSTVTISGAGFGATQSDSVVALDTVPVTPTSWSDTAIVVTVPQGAATGPVSVEVAGATVTGPTFQVMMSLTLTDSFGNQTTYLSEMIGGKWYVYNSQGSGCSSCTLRGNTTRQFDGFGNVISNTDELSHTTSYTYDTNQNMTSVSPQANSGAATTIYAYNNFAEPLTVTDPLGNVTTNTYDVNGNLLTVTTPKPNGSIAASVTQFAYNSLGEMTQITDPLGRLTKIAYTSVGLISTITDAQNNVTTYVYDSRGNRTSVTDAMSNQTTFAYDSGNRLLAITYPGNATTTFTYDYRGRRTSVTDQNGKKTSFVYDDADRLTSVIDPNSHVTYYVYDTESNLTSIEDANGNTTSFGYDAYGRVIQTTFPSTHYEQYGYDAANNLTSKTDRNGQTIQYVYDDLYRLTQKNYPNSTNVEYVYDLVGKLQQVTDPTGTYGFAYDNMGRLVGATAQYTFLSNTTYTNAYTYDADSNRVSMTDPQGGTTSYVYDTLNRLNTLTPPSGFGSGSFGFSYDGLSRRTQMTRPNSVTTNYTYNSLSQLLSVLHLVGTSTIDGATYTVDPAGNRTAKTDMYASVTSNYTYDPLYGLTQVTQATNTTESYSYDPVGNRLSSLGVSPYSVNSSNEITSTPSAAYTYDNNGNTLTKVSSAGTTTYGWDYENRLASVTLPGTGGTLAFKYDGLGRRVQKVFTQGSTTTTTNYLYDGNTAVADVDQNGNVLARYTATQSIDEPLAELRAGTTSFYSQDGLGSITSLTTSAGALGDTYTYDSFGNVTGSSGSIANRFQYTGREFDSETGLYYYRARYYDPISGRFLSEDAIKHASGGANFYSYAHNDPIDRFDPLGLTDYNQQQTQQMLQQAYNSATAGYFQGLENIRNNSQGGGPYDFAHDPNNVHQNDTWTICGVEMSAGDFGNYIAGFQAGAWDQLYYGDPWRPFVRWAEGATYLAGIYYHLRGQSDVPNDPWDDTGLPWIKHGADAGRRFGKNSGACGCN